MTRELALHNGMVTRVDDDVYAWAKDWTWWFIRVPGRKTGYAIGRDPRIPNSKPRRLHRLVVGAVAGEEVDHRDGDGLGNERSNLRKCSRSQNSANRVKFGRGEFKGIKPRRGCWEAWVSVRTRTIYLGRFSNPATAAAAYDLGAIAGHGEFASLNFPAGVPETVDRDEIARAPKLGRFLSERGYTGSLA